MVTYITSQMSEDQLEHYGVLGMKWGVRKGRSSDATSSKKSGSSPKAQNSRFDIPKKKSAHRLHLEAKGVKKGMTLDQAEQAAARRMKGEKIALGILGTAAVAGGAYLAYKGYGKYFTDVKLAKGAEFHYLNALGDKATYDRRLYTTFEKGDVKKYKGMFGEAHLRRQHGAKTVFDTVFKAKEEIRAPSNHEAKKLYDEFRKANSGLRLPKKYKDFNRNDVMMENAGAKKFMGFMKGKGFNAILDMNDQYVSGFDAKKPLIIFNANSSLTKTGQRVLSQAETQAQLNREMPGYIGRTFGPAVGLGAAYVWGMGELDKHSKSLAIDKLRDEGKYKDYSDHELYNAMRQGNNGFIIDKRKLKTQQ